MTAEQVTMAVDRLRYLEAAALSALKIGVKYSIIETRIQRALLQIAEDKGDSWTAWRYGIHRNSIGLGVLEGLPPAVRQAARCMKAVRPIRAIKLDLYEENLDVNVETGPNGTNGEALHFPGAEAKALRLFRDPKSVTDVWLSFQIKTQADSANTAFSAGKFGDEVRITAKGQPELPGTEEPEPKQPDLEFPEVEAQPKKKRGPKKAPKASKKKARTIPRQLGQIRRKKDKKK